MKIYIAGPITGMVDYKKKFREAEERVKEMGHIAINPSFLPEGLKNYMEICKAMIDQADSVLFLDGWEDSTGANIEFVYAKEKGKRILTGEVLLDGD
jgi:nucleoside 2-deoxyribosyltransferase